MSTHVNMLRHEVLALLREHDVGRLCVFDGEFPIAFPVNYRLVHTDAAPGGGDVIVVQTGSNTTIARAEGPASIEIDHVDRTAGSAWSVIARGDLRQVHGDHGLPSTDPLVTTGRDQWLRLHITAVSGRRFQLSAASSLDRGRGDRDLRP